MQDRRIGFIKVPVRQADETTDRQAQVPSHQERATEKKDTFFLVLHPLCRLGNPCQRLQGSLVQLRGRTATNVVYARWFATCLKL